MNKTGKGQRETAKSTVSKMVQCYHHHLQSPEYLVDYFHISQIQVNRTNGIRNTKTVTWKEVNFTQSENLTKIIKNKLSFNK